MDNNERLEHSLDFYAAINDIDNEIIEKNKQITENNSKSKYTNNLITPLLIQKIALSKILFHKKEKICL